MSGRGVSDKARALIAECRKAAEEWGATMEPIWSERADDAEALLEDYIASLESPESSESVISGTRKEQEQP